MKLQLLSGISFSMWDSYAKSYTNNRNEKSYNYLKCPDLSILQWMNTTKKWLHSHVPQLTWKCNCQMATHAFPDSSSIFTVWTDRGGHWLFGFSLLRQARAKWFIFRISYMFYIGRDREHYDTAIDHRKVHWKNSKMLVSCGIGMNRRGFGNYQKIV